jgi:hypothetical protein
LSELCLNIFTIICMNINYYINSNQNLCLVLTRLWISSAISFIKSKNSKRPRTDPCGTPTFNVPGVEIELFNKINLKFNSQNINQVDNHKHLGVTISGNCKWAEHINNICQKATKQIFVLRKLKFILNRNNLNKIWILWNKVSFRCLRLQLSLPTGFKV